MMYPTHNLPIYGEPLLQKPNERDYDKYCYHPLFCCIIGGYVLIMAFGYVYQLNHEGSESY